MCPPRVDVRYPRADTQVRPYAGETLQLRGSLGVEGLTIRVTSVPPASAVDPYFAHQ
jgi:hypothetical protein